MVVWVCMKHFAITLILSPSPNKWLCFVPWQGDIILVYHFLEVLYNYRVNLNMSLLLILPQPSPSDFGSCWITINAEFGIAN